MTVEMMQRFREERKHTSMRFADFVEKEVEAGRAQVMHWQS
jgi:hypothetical protein